jgi:hypothetical protein
LLARLNHADPGRGWPGYEAAIAELASQIPGFAGIDHRAGTALGYAARPQRVPSPLVAVAQLRAVDVADLCAPAGADLLQVLWCPNEHEDGGGSWAPAVMLRWRRAAALSTVSSGPPAPEDTASEPRYRPRPCVLHPEQVVEHPWWQDLPSDLGRRVQAWDTEQDGVYHRQLSTAPGWKVGGFPPWPTTDPAPMYCQDCGCAMRHLLQLDSTEWGDAHRWRPHEEHELRPGTAGYAAAREPTGVVAGRSGLYRLFYCPSCPGVPARADLQ